MITRNLFWDVVVGTTFNGCLNWWAEDEKMAPALYNRLTFSA